MMKEYKIQCKKCGEIINVAHITPDGKLSFNINGEKANIIIDECGDFPKEELKSYKEVLKSICKKVKPIKSKSVCKISGLHGTKTTEINNKNYCHYCLREIRKKKG